MNYSTNWAPEAKFSELVGKTLERFDVSDDKDRIELVCTDGSIYVLYHRQDFREISVSSVSVESITGDVADLIGSPILVAEESSSNSEDPQGYLKVEIHRDSFTWTFYKLATAKGWVDLRWLGESNGHYSESVTLARVSGPKT